MMTVGSIDPKLPDVSVGIRLLVVRHLVEIGRS